MVYKLYYFNLRARAEPLRQIMAYASREFEDIRVKVEEWPELKPKMPFGTMPVLEVDGGQKIPQTFAIARFLAHQHDLLGKTPFDRAWVDAFADQFKDYDDEFNKFWHPFVGFGKGDKEALKTEVGIPARDKFFPLVEKRLADAGKGFLVGDGVTWVDFVLSSHVSVVQEKLPGWFAAYPGVVAHVATIERLPGVREWIQKRIDTPC